MGSKQATQTSTNTAEPWTEQKPYITYGLQQAKDIYTGAGPEYFPQSTVAGFSPEQQQAMDLTKSRALTGNSTMDAAEGFARDSINGAYSGDPYQSQVYANMASSILPSVNAQFSAAGRYGSDAHADTMTRALTEGFAPYASQQYQAGLDRRSSAAAMAPGFAANDYTDISALDAVGGQRQQLAQSEIDDAQARWNFAQDRQANKLGQYMGFIGGNYGGTTTSAQPYYKPSTASQIIGGGLALAGLFG